jgi:hypothetical protein
VEASRAVSALAVEVLGSPAAWLNFPFGFPGYAAYTLLNLAADVSGYVG